MGSILYIDLSPFEFECHICDCECSVPHHKTSYGVAGYEDLAVPDDYKEEWGGFPVCERCYFVERGLRAKYPCEMIPFATIRAISVGSGRAN